MTTHAALQSLTAQGESETLAFKRSTAERRRAGETLCAFVNDEDGHMVGGVGPDGKLVGQQVAGITFREIAAMLGRFGPPARVEVERADVGEGHTVIVLEAPPARECAPFISEGKPNRCVGSTTTAMSLYLLTIASVVRWRLETAVGVHGHRRRR